ncbi:sulfatase family protein [Pigmentiphaga kullae]|uniref:Arylsulfatase A-like enzyme n=1 Tax=Pigmentiphaga kullae TaxID=151784 RepID=A0A4Q7NGW1_9BURK|nr:sulfatase-like hydrolase/transferase [Pigmentiphaga kullae]RZS84194.1 arylsulfatase A-like enzyme [Pigmentiphaga kullae]
MDPRASKRPNILLVMTDQQRADHLGCYGNPILRTPHLDALARDGVRASQFYVASPTCMSNRATLMTGRMPSLHGVLHNGIPLSREDVTFVELLRDAGYATALIGKSHLQNFGYNNPPIRGWENLNGGTPPADAMKDAHRHHRRGREYDNEWTPYWKTDPSFHVQTPFYGFDDVRLCTMHGDRVQGDYARWLAERHPDPDSLRGREHAIPDDRYDSPQAWRTRMPVELYPSTYVAEQTCEWLARHARRDDDAPFFIQCSFPDPHHPFTPPGKYWDMYDPADIPLPPSFHQENMPALLRAVHERTRAGASREAYVPFALNERECREVTALTYGSISLVDDSIGRVLAKLDELGLREDTVVIFTSDHGEMMGDHGIALKGVMHYRSVTQVPFIWHDPQLPGPRRGAVVDDVAGTIDIAQTILARAGLAPFNGIQGANLLPALRGEAAPPPERAGIVVESEPLQYAFGRPRRFKVRTLFDGRYRLTLSDDPAVCEFYDLEADPHEVEDLWNEPSARGQRDRLVAALAVEMIRLSESSPLPSAQA